MCLSVCLSQVLCMPAMYKCSELGWNGKGALDLCKGLRDGRETGFWVCNSLSCLSSCDVPGWAPHRQSAQRERAHRSTNRPRPPITGSFCLQQHCAFLDISASVILAEPDDTPAQQPNIFKHI